MESHADYLERLGEERRASLAFPAPQADYRPPADGSGAHRQEQLIVLGARAVAELVRERGYDTLLAGIGASHMSAWLAARLLAADGVQVQVARTVPHPKLLGAVRAGAAPRRLRPRRTP
ncbi:hypothetical protein SMICM17S_12720 [Streptomyces microflavus]